jgi:hypothetical protein
MTPRVPLPVALALLLAGCGAPAAVPAAATAAAPPPAAPANVPRPPFARAGQTTSSVGGAELVHEQYEDDGDTLVCHVDAKGKKATERLSRADHTVRIEQDGQTVTRHAPKGAVILETFCWQQLLVAAEDYRTASTPTPVQVYVPGADVTADATIQVDTAPSGDRYVTVMLKELRLSADISADGAVEHVRIPAQHVEARGKAGKAPVEDAK